MAKMTFADWLRRFFGVSGRKKISKTEKIKKIKRVIGKRGKPRKVKLAKKKRARKIIKKVKKIKIRAPLKKIKHVAPKKEIKLKKKPVAKPGFFAKLFAQRKPAALKKFPEKKPAVTIIKKQAKEVKRPIPKKLPKEIVKEFVASDIMTKRVVGLKTNDSLSYVVRLFGDKQISGAPVLSRSGTLVGTLSDTEIEQFVGAKDLLDAQTNRLDKLKETKVEEVMKRGPLTVFEHTPIHEINDLINKHNAQRAIVLDQRRQLAGIITRGDLVRGISKEMLFRMVHKPREFERDEINTDLDDVLEAIERKGSISIPEIKQKLNMPEDKIEEWGRILEKHNLIEIFYPPIGRPIFRKRVS